MQLFDKVPLNEEDMIDLFLRYLYEVEEMAQSYREEGQQTSETQAKSAEANERTRRILARSGRPERRKLQPTTTWIPKYTRARTGQPERQILQPTPKCIPKHRRHRHNASGPEQELQADTRDDATARGRKVPIVPLTPEDSEEEVKKKEKRRKRFGDMVEQA